MTDTCTNCGEPLTEEHLASGSCPSCGREVRPSDGDAPIDEQEASEEASRDSFPASDPPSFG